MTALTAILGTDVVSRADAEKLGKVEGVVVDIATRRVTAWQVGKGRKATFVAQEHLSGIGNAAVVIDAAESLHPAANPAEEATAKGHADLIKALVLSEAGDQLGHIVDVDIDTATGALQQVRTDLVQVPSELMLGFGAFALVVALPGSNGTRGLDGAAVPAG